MELKSCNCFAWILVSFQTQLSFSFDTVININESWSGEDAHCGAANTSCQINCNSNCNQIDIYCPTTRENCNKCEINCFDCGYVEIHSEYCANVNINAKDVNSLFESDIYLPNSNGIVNVTAKDNGSGLGGIYMTSNRFHTNNKESNNSVTFVCDGVSCNSNQFNTSQALSLDVLCINHGALSYNTFYCPENDYQDGTSCNIEYDSTGAAYQNYFFAKDGIPAVMCCTSYLLSCYFK